MFGKKISKIISFVCSMALVFVCLTSGAFAVEKAAYEPTKAPIIKYFTTSSDNVEPGSTVTLSWKILGAKSAVITGEEKEIECVLEDSAEVWPMVTTIYTLHAYGFNGEEVTSSLTVKVGEAVIKSFTATPDETAPGNDVTLAWDVYNAESVTIKELGDNTLPAQGSLKVNPYISTTYTLVAKGYDGATVSTPIVVKVKTPEIVSFTADKTDIAPGDKVVLSWDVLYAKSISITGAEQLPEVNNSSIEVAPLTTTTYTLVVEGFDSSKITKEVTVNVKTPEIVSFTADKTDIAPGDKVVLSWDVLYAKSISIIGAEQLPEVNNSSIEVAPLTTTTYTLVVEGFDSSKITKEVTVNVKTPEIVSFKADKTEIVPGDTVVLSWDVLYAKSISIKGIEKEPEVISGSIEVWPLATTIYIITAEGYDGSIITKEITVTVKSPLITSFTASKTTIKKGEMVKLSWTTKNAVKCSIVTNIGQKIPSVPINSSISVTPNKNITFTLIAIDGDGNKAEKSIDIVVN